MGDIKRIVFDTETTGLLAPKAAPIEKQPYVTELYAVKLDENFEILEEFESFFHIPILVPVFITRITGISDAMLVDAPTFEEKAEEISKFFADSTEMIAHNLPFDKAILAYQFKRACCPIIFPEKQTCTIQKSMKLRGRRLKLADLHTEMTGETFADAHRARNDVHATVRCYYHMLKRGLCD